MPTALLPRFSLKTWLIACVAFALNSLIWASAALGQTWAICFTLGEAGILIIWTSMVLTFGAAYVAASFADLFRRKRTVASPFATADEFSPRQIEPPVDYQ